MKKNINKYLLAFLSAIFIIACSDDENPFEGNNAHITSFALTVDGVKYPASISKNDIIISVAKGVDLSSAKVEYAISENASLQPDPKTITNWDEEQIFRVNAWNNEFESYKYIIKRTDVIDPDNVVLLTQADVNEFAKKGITKIKGNLIIGQTTIPCIEFDTITDLTPLRTITSVDLNVVIKDGCSWCNFEGLNNIKYAGGFYFGSLSEPLKMGKALDLELYQLEKVNNLVINTDSLKSLSLPQLSSAGKIYINSNKLASLDIASLENCIGDFILKAYRNSYAEDKSNISLRNINLANLNLVGGTLSIENFWKVTELNLSKLKTVNQDLKLKFIRTISEISLPELTNVEGSMKIESNDGLTDFLVPKLISAASVFISSYNMFSLNLDKIDLASLTTVDNDLTIRFASSTKLEFPKLNTVGNDFTIKTMSYVETILLPELSSCEQIILSGTKSLSSFKTPKLTVLNNLQLSSCNSLLELKMPTVLNGDLSIYFGGQAYDFPNLQGLEEVNGILELQSCGSEIINVTGIKKLGSFDLNYSEEIKSITFPDLTEINQNFNISRLENLTDFSAPELTSIGNNLSIDACLVLTNINLPKLTSITGQFKFYGARGSWQASESIIENMDAFSALTSAGSVDVKYAGKLKDYNGLKNLIGSLTVDFWSVQNCLYNPSYDDMVDGKYSNN